MIDLAQLRAYVATMRELGVKRVRLDADVEIELFTPVLSRAANASVTPVSGAPGGGSEARLQDQITQYLAEQGGTWVGSRTSLKQVLGINNRDHALLKAALEALVTSGRVTEQRARKGQAKQATYVLINHTVPAQSQVSGLLSHVPETDGPAVMPGQPAPAHEPSAMLPASASTASPPTALSAGLPAPAPLPVASVAEDEDYVLKVLGPLWLGSMATLLDAVLTKSGNVASADAIAEEVTRLRGQVRDWQTNGLGRLAEIEAAADATLKVCASWFAAGYLEHDVLKDPTHATQVHELDPATREIRRDAAVKALHGPVQREVTASAAELEPLANDPYANAIVDGKLMVGGDDPRVKRAVAAAAAAAAARSGKPSAGGRGS